MFIFVSKSWWDSITICLSGFLEQRGFGLASAARNSHTPGHVWAPQHIGEKVLDGRKWKDLFIFFLSGQHGLFWLFCSLAQLVLSSHSSLLNIPKESIFSQRCWFLPCFLTEPSGTNDLSAWVHPLGGCTVDSCSDLCRAGWALAVGRCEDGVTSPVSVPPAGWWVSPKHQWRSWTSEA